MSMDNANRPEPARLRVVTETAPAVSLKSILAETAPRRKRGLGRFRNWLVAAGALGALGLLAWFYFGQGEAYTYTTGKVARGDLTVTVTATGTVEPIARVDVSTAISGIVRKVNVDYNSVVHSGDVLAELDMSNLSANVAGARARLAAARANAESARVAAEAAATVLDRQLALRGRGVVSEQALDDAQRGKSTSAAAADAAKAEILVAEADLQQAATNLAWATVVSPIDGVVLTRNVDEGSTVAASFQAPVLFSIAGDLKQMEVQLDVDEADIGSVAVGQPAVFTVDAFRDRRFPAEIKTIRFVSETINNVVTYKALLRVDNSDLSLRPGMTATADIVVNKVSQALLLPNAALRYTPPQQTSGGGFLFFRAPNMSAVTSVEQQGAQRTVWVMRDKVPTAVQIEIGATDGQNTEIRSGGLTEGDLVITDATAAK